MSDYLEREAAIRYIKNKLERARFQNITVASYLAAAEKNEKFSLVDVLCDCIAALAQANEKLVQAEVERQLRTPAIFKIINQGAKDE